MSPELNIEGTPHVLLGLAFLFFPSLVPIKLFALQSGKESPSLQGTAQVTMTAPKMNVWGKWQLIA